MPRRSRGPRARPVPAPATSWAAIRRIATRRCTRLLLGAPRILLFHGLPVLGHLFAGQQRLDARLHALRVVGLPVEEAAFIVRVVAAVRGPLRRWPGLLLAGHGRD